MAEPAYRLKTQHGDKHPITHDQLILGSAPDVNSIIAVESVDPRHASLTFEGDDSGAKKVRSDNVPGEPKGNPGLAPEG